MQLRRRDVNLLEGPILKNVLLFAIPIMFSSILQLLFNAADVIVVGQFAGQTELAAVGSTGSTVNLIVNLCIGLSIGTNVVVARYIGEQNTEGIRRTVHTSILLSIISGLLAGAVLFFCSGALMRLLRTPADILPSASAYLKAYAVGVPASIIYNFGTAILRAKGDTTRPLYFLAIAGVVNVALNLLFVIVFGMGAVGVGIATAASQYVAATLVTICLIHEEGAVKLYVGRLRLYKKEFLSIVAIGIPAGIQSCMFSISNMLIQSSINSFNSTAIVAGNSAAANIEGFVYVAMNAMYQTVLTVTGQNLGARNFGRIDKGLSVCCGCVTVIGAVLGGLVVLCSKPLLSIYSTDSEVIFYGSQRFLFLALPYFLCGLMDTLMGAVRGLGYAVVPMVVSIMGACVFRVFWIFTVFQKYHTLPSLFISYTISWILTGGTHLICYLILRKKVRRKFSN